MQQEHYQIRVEGHLDDTWRDWLGGLEIRHEADGRTVLLVQVEDQAALHGILTKIRDLNLRLVSLNRIDG